MLDESRIQRRARSASGLKLAGRSFGKGTGIWPAASRAYLPREVFFGRLGLAGAFFSGSAGDFGRFFPATSGSFR